MNKKNSMAILLAFLITGGSIAVSTAETSSTVSSQVAQAEQRVEQSKIRVYYFHGNMRCATCKKIEALTKKIVEGDFAGQLKDGSMELQVINVDQAKNEHFVKDYELAIRSVVVSKIEKGKEKKWRRLDQVWQLVHDETAFADYLRQEITALVKEKS